MINTPLHVAVRIPAAWRRYDPVPILLARTENVDNLNQAGRTALFEAIRFGNRGDIDRLLDAGSDPNLADHHGHTPAHAAAILTGSSNAEQANNAFEILQLLVEKGADVSLRDQEGRTVKDCLQFFGNRQMETRQKTESPQEN